MPRSISSHITSILASTSPLERVATRGGGSPLGVGRVVAPGVEPAPEARATGPTSDSRWACSGVTIPVASSRSTKEFVRSSPLVTFELVEAAGTQLAPDRIGGGSPYDASGPEDAEQVAVSKCGGVEPQQALEHDLDAGLAD